jgi:predicted ester cyclase
MKLAALSIALSLIAVAAAPAAELNTPAANLAVIRTQIEEQNRGDWRTALDVYTPNSKNFGRPVGRAVLARIFEDIWGTFPDWHVDILDITAVGDSVIVREKTSGTHEGVGKIPVNGGMLVGVPPTHRRFEAESIHWFKLKDGKIADHYATRDDLAMMQQLGLSPSPQPFDWGRFAMEANRR